MSKLETENLVLKVRTLADVDSLLQLHPEADRDTIVKSVFISDTHWRKNGFGYWSIFLKNALIGTIGLKRGLDRTVSLELEIEPKHRRNGFAKEASLAVLDFAFRLHKLAEVLATVKTLNTPALNLLKALGFTAGNATDESTILSLPNPSKR